MIAIITPVFCNLFAAAEP